jgi:hypothetical protein
VVTTRVKVDLTARPADAGTMQRWLGLAIALAACAGLAFPSTIVCDYGPGGNVNNEKPY